jgi:hypothetical protein
VGEAFSKGLKPKPAALALVASELMSNVKEKANKLRMLLFYTKNQILTKIYLKN